MKFLNAPIVDMVISLVLIYAFLSTLVSILIEWWNHYTKARAKMLKKAIRSLLYDPLNKDYGSLLYNHYMISGLNSSEFNRPPQYISDNLFAETLIDVIAQQARHSLKIELSPIKDLEEVSMSKIQTDLVVSKEVMKRFKGGLEMMNASPLRDTLFSLYDKADENYSNLKLLLNSWYNDYMDRVSGWYKTKQRFNFLFFGFAVAIFLNVDSMHLIKMLSLDKDLTNNLVAVAEESVDKIEAERLNSAEQTIDFVKTLYPDSLDKPEQIIQFLGADSTLYKDLLKKIDSTNAQYLERIDSSLAIVSSLNLPIGWKKDSAPLSWFTKKESIKVPDSHKITTYIEGRNNRSWTSGFWYFLGIFISGISLSFGAPFWFDILVKFVNIRRAGTKPKSTN